MLSFSFREKREIFQPLFVSRIRLTATSKASRHRQLNNFAFMVEKSHIDLHKRFWVNIDTVYVVENDVKFSLSSFLCMRSHWFVWWTKKVHKKKFNNEWLVTSWQRCRCLCFASYDVASQRLEKGDDEVAHKVHVNRVNGSTAAKSQYHGFISVFMRINYMHSKETLRNCDGTFYTATEVNKFR